jgi:hypothetical protein
MLLPCGRENPKYRDQSRLCLDYTFSPCGRENPKYRDQNQLHSDYTLSPFGRENPKYRDQTHRKQLQPKLWVCHWTWSLAPQVIKTNFVSQYARRGQSSKERDPQKRESSTSSANPIRTTPTQTTTSNSWEQQKLDGASLTSQSAHP